MKAAFELYFVHAREACLYLVQTFLPQQAYRQISTGHYTKYFGKPSGKLVQLAISKKNDITGTHRGGV